MLANLIECNVLMEKSRERLLVAQSLHDDGYFEDAVSRSYYAMFFAARALLLTLDITPKTHRGVIVTLSDQFVKNGLMHYEIWEYLAAGETLREEADYSSEKRIDDIRSQTTLEHAKEFVRTCSQILNSSP
ncbi:HEPN domain-containing protein [Methanospirillum stamsii]|nr:HEPN domain-containing protein [Methanospirillum stamsii]